MTPAEFVDRALSVPWVRWGSDWSGADCFGLIVMWHRHVLGVDLGDVPRTDIASGFASATGWQRCEAASGATAFMAFRDGAPGHCGIVLDGLTLLHAQGDTVHGGRVKVSRISAMQRIYSDIQFFRRATC
jgi:cell wall-associated NlpC family hydrolase